MRDGDLRWALRELRWILLAVAVWVGAILTFNCAHASDIGPPNYVTVEIENDYYKTAILRLYIITHGVKRRLTTISRPHQTVRIHTVRPLGDSFLYLEAWGEEPWSSMNLLLFNPGDCIQLNIGALPKFTGVLRCRKG